MKPAASSATPDMMTLLCIIGGAMRGEGPVGLGLQLLLIGTVFPQFGWLIRTWLRMEEFHAAGHVWDNEVSPDDEDDDDDDAAGESRSGWVCQDGDVWLWRHVSLVGVVIVPVHWFSGYRNAAFLPRGRVWAATWSLCAATGVLFFVGDLGYTHTYALFVALS